MYGVNYSGGDNRTHGQVEQAARIDSFEAGKLKGLEVLFAYQGDGMIPLDCDHYTVYGPGSLKREVIELAYPRSRWGDTLQLTRISSGFGGTRAFWLCPFCGRRVRYLYFKNWRFQCRECAHLNYRSQQETKDSMCDYRRGMAFAENKLSVNPAFRLDGFDFCEYIPERPKGMHETTYRRYLSRFLKYRERHTARTMADMKKFIGLDGWMELMNIMDGK